jgi:peptide/nickel transport system substrate-binding protein
MTWLRACLVLMVSVLMACSPAAPSAPTAAPAAPKPTAPAAAPQPTAVAAQPTAAQAPAAAPTPAQASGGQIVLSQADDPVTLNPAISALATTVYHSQFVFDGLTRPDKKLRPSPSLAESWEVSPDGLSYTFKLRKGVKFQDGSPFTAQDVKFTWELIAHPDNKAGAQIAGYFGNIEGAAAYRAGSASSISGITTPDENTVQVKLSTPYGPFLAVSAFQPILPRSVYGSIKPEDLGKDKTARSPVGTGPFKLTDWRANDQMVYTANADYWGGKPRVDRLILKTVADSSTLPALLRSGAVDVVGMTTSLPSLEFQSFSDDKTFTVREMAGGWNRYVEFNLVNPLFQDVKVRQALNYAVDRKAIVDGLYLGHARIVNGPIHPESWAYSEPKTQYGYDPEKARSLLAEAGWTPGADGILTKDGQPFSFTLLTYPEFAKDYPLALQDNWRKVGVDAKLQPMEFAAIFAPLYLTGKFDAFAFQMPIGTYSDPSYPLNGYFGSALNRNKYNNPKVDALIKEAADTADEGQRKALYADMIEQLAEDAPHMWPVMPNDIWISTNKVKLPEADLAFLLFVNIKDWARQG